jgi:hypothetical protein
MTPYAVELTALLLSIGVATAGLVFLMLWRRLVLYSSQDTGSIALEESLAVLGMSQALRLSGRTV